jgi:5'-3' exoribonuclease 2
MGIPSFYKWLSVRYPKCLIDALSNESLEQLKQNYTGVCGEALELLSKKENPPIDNLYLDLNSVIHNCAKPSTGLLPTCEEDIFAAIYDYIDVIMRVSRPQKVVYMAIDGVAPRAKLNQQRGRRFRKAMDEKERQKKEKNLREMWGYENTKSECPHWKFDGNTITPGTEFMHNLA